jgi:protein-L-isoaspartate(D-aspartate) O-methyltransferase
MVERQLRARGIRDPKVLEAFRVVRREEFVPHAERAFAYDDTPLPIGEGQTISQPYIVALTVEALGLLGSERVLEIGTGSGYAAAILGLIAKEVYSVERLAGLAATATSTLSRLGFDNVRITCADGSLGWPEHAPYDGIAVSAAAPVVPAALLSQLAPGGRLVIPLGSEEEQLLVRFTRVGAREFRKEALSDVRFVPLIGEQGFSESQLSAASAFCR